MAKLSSSGAFAFLLLLVGQVGFAEDGWDCGDSEPMSPAASEVAVRPDSMRGLVIWVRDSAAGAVLVPSWSNEVWDSSFDHSILSYFQDVSFGNFSLTLDHVYGSGDSTYLTAHGLSALTRNDLINFTPNYQAFLLHLMQRVDSVVDFANYDIFGFSDGSPDNFVDFVCLLIAAQGGAPIAFPGLRGSYMSNDSANGQPVEVGGWGLTGYRVDVSTEAGFATMAVHEWLHLLGPFGDRDHLGSSIQYKHYALGSFDPMSRPGFGASGWPSAYTPIDRDSLGWDSIQTVDDDAIGQVLLDHSKGPNRVFAILPPRNVKLVNNSQQRFVVSYHGQQADNPWEQEWPNRGLLIWHHSTGNGGSGWADQQWRPIKLETSSGLFDWIDSVTIDTSSPNPIQGFDSLDWRLVWTDEFKNVGSKNWLWGWDSTRTKIDQVTNPNTNFYRRHLDSTFQDIPSHLAVRNIAFAASRDSAHADLFTNAWTGVVAADDSLFGPSAVIMGDLTIPESVTLVIDSGTTVYMLANEDVQAAGDPNRVEIIVRGHLVAKGTASHPIIFKSNRPAGDSLSWRGIVVDYSGQATFEYCEFEDMSHGLSIDGADSVSVKHCTFDNIGYVALSVERGDSSAPGDSIPTQNVPKGTIIQDCEFVGGALAGSCGIVIDTGTAATISDISVEEIPNAILFRQSSGSLRDVTVEGADTAVYAAVLADSTLTLDNVYFFQEGIVKGIAARSGTIIIDSSSIYAHSLTALDAFTGSAKIRATNTEFVGSPTASAAVSIGPDARLYAKDCSMLLSWIGIESHANAADSIIHCYVYGNEMYGIRLDSSDVADYTKHNHIEGEMATSSNIAYLVNRQSVISVSDTIKGGYNWNFDFYSADLPGLKATVSGMHVKGKAGDDWGFVLNGLASIGDSAFVSGILVDSVFTVSHLYMRYLYVDIEDCILKSISDSLLASPYIIKDLGGTSGKIRCTKALNARTDCVNRGDSSSHISYGEATSFSTHGNNSFYVTDTLKQRTTKYFRSAAGSVKAEKNWWGKATPNSNRFAGSVDYTPTLSTGPICEAGGSEKVVAEMPESEDGVLPAEFALEQNFPNPFNPTTRINFQLPQEQRVRIDVFNTLGRSVRSFDLGVTAAGFHSISWDGRDHAGHPVGSGVYLYRIVTPEYAETKKMLLLK